MNSIGKNPKSELMNCSEKKGKGNIFLPLFCWGCLRLLQRREGEWQHFQNVSGGLRHHEPHGDDVTIKFANCSEKKVEEYFSYLSFVVAACICFKERRASDELSHHGVDDQCFIFKLNMKPKLLVNVHPHHLALWNTHTHKSKNKNEQNTTTHHNCLIPVVMVLFWILLQQKKDLRVLAE